MAEAGTLAVLVPEITIEELFTAQGADLSRRSPRQDMVDLNVKLLAEARELAKVSIIWQEAKVLGSEQQELYLEGGLTLRGSLLPKVLGPAESAVLFAMTIGEGIDERVKEYTHQGKTLEAFILDAAGSAILAKAAYHAISELAGLYKEKQLDTTFSLGPGHSYWKGLEDVRTIIDYLKGEQIGISLTDSNLMLPKKSIAMVMGVGSNLPDFKGKTHCDFCHLKGSCTMRELGVNNC